MSYTYPWAVTTSLFHLDSSSVLLHPFFPSSWHRRCIDKDSLERLLEDAHQHYYCLQDYISLNKALIGIYIEDL